MARSSDRRSADSLPLLQLARQQVRPELGTTDKEIVKGVAQAGLTRHWSAILNGMQIDFPNLQGRVRRRLTHSRIPPEPTRREPAAFPTAKGKIVTTDVNPTRYVIRHALPCDIRAIRAMQARSMWTLGAGFYARAEIANFMEAFGTMDDAIVPEGHFFLAEDASGAILASGGWSRSTPGYAAALPTGKQVAAMPSVRGVFVDPAVARRGLGRSIMRHVEEDAMAHGVQQLTLTATLSGVRLYERLGYQVEEVLQIRFPDQTGFGCVKMKKALQRDVSPADPARASRVPIESDREL